MNINADYNSDQFRSKINFFTPIRQLAESKLIFFAPLGARVNEENQ